MEGRYGETADACSLGKSERCPVIRLTDSPRSPDKLLIDTPPLVAMWRALEKRSILDDDLWVWAFLEAATDATNLPPYHNAPARERRKLTQAITDSANKLARMLAVNELDAHLIHSDSGWFKGFSLYEDFGDSNRARIDAAETNKLKVSVLIQGIADRAKEKICDEPLPGKTGRNARAIRFIRLIAKRNMSSYKVPLNAVTATAVNVLFETSYEESDIRKLLSR